MVASTDVQFICSDNFNAPSLGNFWGALISLLDGCLVNGLNLPTLNGVTGDGNQVTISFSTSHQLKMFQVLRLKGFTPESLNGDYRIIGVPNALSVVIESNATTILTIGTVILKPLGYEKVFSGVNKAVYRDQDITHVNRPFLRVDNSLDPVYTDSFAKYAKVGVFENCISIDDISGAQIPLDASNTTKNWVGTGSGVGAYSGWAKWYFARNTSAYNSSADTSPPQNGNRTWMVIGDSQGFYLINNLTPNDEDKLLYGFGVYSKVDGINAKPYFLLATLSYVAANTGIDLSVVGGGAPFYSNESPALLFNGAGTETQVDARPAHGLYKSGAANTYANLFAGSPYTLLGNSFLMGNLPHLRYIHKLRSDPKFSTVAYSNYMYVIDLVMRGNRYAFNLGEL